MKSDADEQCLKLMFPPLFNTVYNVLIVWKLILWFTRLIGYWKTTKGFHVRHYGR